MESQRTYDYVIARRNMLAEVFGAYLWSCTTKSEHIFTDPDVKMTDANLKLITGKSVLIVGGYYRDNMAPIINAAADVTVFYNASDDVISHDGYTVVRGTSTSGFLSWTVNKLNVTLPYVCRMADLLDQYLYGWPTEEALCFQNGIYTIDKPDDLGKLLSVLSDADIDAIIVAGRTKRIANKRIADERVKKSSVYTFNVNGTKYRAAISIGDSPIVDTCIALAVQTGIGILLRYDLAAEKTFMSIRTTRESGIDAGKLAGDLVGGGGSMSMGGGQIGGLHFPDAIVDRLSEPKWH